LKSLKDGKPVADLFEISCGVPFSLGWIVQAFLANFPVTSSETRANRKASENIMIVEKIKVVVEILVQIGTSPQLKENPAAGEAPVVEEFRHVLRLAVYYLRKLCKKEDEAQYSVLHSALYLSASVSLISDHPMLNFDRWSLRDSSAEDFSAADDSMVSRLRYASNLAQKAACGIASTHAGDEDYSLVASAIRPCISLYQLQLLHLSRSGPQGVSDVAAHPNLLTTVEALCRARSQAPIVEASKRCAISVLSRLCDKFHLDGEKLHAVQAACWNDVVSARAQDGADNHPWFEATAISLQACDTVVPLDIPINWVTVDFISPSIAEGAACRLRQRLFCPRPSGDLIEIENELTSLVQRIDESVVASGSDESATLFLWAKSTSLLTLSELFGICGRFDAGLAVAKECFQVCRILSGQVRGSRNSMLKRHLDAPHFWEEVAFSTMRMRCLRRQVDCYRLVAVFYARKGDWRRAERQYDSVYSCSFCCE